MKPFTLLLLLVLSGISADAMQQPKLPKIAYGTDSCNDEVKCKKNLLNAVQAGFRMFDLALSYNNVELVGKALREATVATEGVTMDNLVLCFKIMPSFATNLNSYAEQIETACKLVRPVGKPFDVVMLHQVPVDDKELSVHRSLPKKLATHIGISNVDKEYLKQHGDKGMLLHNCYIFSSPFY